MKQDEITKAIETLKAKLIAIQDTDGTLPASIPVELPAPKPASKPAPSAEPYAEFLEKFPGFVGMVEKEIACPMPEHFMVVKKPDGDWDVMTLAELKPLPLPEVHAAEDTKELLTEMVKELTPVLKSTFKEAIAEEVTEQLHKLIQTMPKGDFQFVPETVSTPPTVLPKVSPTFNKEDVDYYAILGCSHHFPYAKGVMMHFKQSCAGGAEGKLFQWALDHPVVAATVNIHFKSGGVANLASYALAVAVMHSKLVLANAEGKK